MSKRNFLHASLQLLTLGVALKHAHLLRKGILKFLQFTTSSCTACTALACYTSPLTPVSSAQIFTGTEQQQRGSGGKNNRGLIFWSDMIGLMSPLLMKGNKLYVKYYWDNLSFPEIHLHVCANQSPATRQELCALEFKHRTCCQSSM